MKLFIGSDHAGFKAKEKLKRFLNKKGIDFEDLGASIYEPLDDYTDFAIAVAEKVAKTKNSKGIIICGTGLGSSIVANKVKGIRAAVVYDKYTALKSRLDNDSNVLALRGRKCCFWKIKKIVNMWLETPFSGVERHKRRLQKIKSIENKK